MEGSTYVEFFGGPSQMLTITTEVSTRVQVSPEEKSEGIKEVNGVKYGMDSFFGVKVALPV